MSTILLNSITHSFPAESGAFPVLQDINLRVDGADVLSILGPSGCGKSTLLKIVAGLLKPSIGTVLIDSHPPQTLLETSSIGFAFQEPTLLHWRTVEENISLVTEFSNTKKTVGVERIDKVLQLVGLTEYRHFFPDQLSGGMKQRVGLARSIVLDPDILLLDEPLASLDLITRTELMLELSSIFETMNLATIVVTHSIEEAVLWGTKIAIFSDRPGHVIEEIRHPRSSRRDLAYMETSEFQHLAAHCRERMFSRKTKDRTYEAN